MVLSNSLVDFSLSSILNVMMIRLDHRNRRFHTERFARDRGLWHSQKWWKGPCWSTKAETHNPKVLIIFALTLPKYWLSSLRKQQWFTVNKGPQFSTSTAKPETDLTVDMLTSSVSLLVALIGLQSFLGGRGRHPISKNTISRLRVLQLRVALFIHY